MNLASWFDEVFSSPVKKYRELLLSLLMLMLASHYKVLCQNYFYLMGKALSGELSCIRTGLVLALPYDIETLRLEDKQC